MTYKRTLTFVALVAIIGAAFYAGVVTERSEIEQPAPFFVTEAFAADGTITLCGLYDLFTEMEEGFGEFADILDALIYFNEGVDCSVTVATDETTNERIEVVKDDKAKKDCPSNPCSRTPAEYQTMVKAYGEAAMASSAALNALLERVELPEAITYMSGNLESKPPKK